MVLGMCEAYEDDVALHRSLSSFFASLSRFFAGLPFPIPADAGSPMLGLRPPSSPGQGLFGSPQTQNESADDFPNQAPAPGQGDGGRFVQVCTLVDLLARGS